MIEEVTIVGTGVLGSQLAQVIADYGIKVVMKTREKEDPLANLRKNLAKGEKKGKLTHKDAQRILGNVSSTNSMGVAVSHADMVLEAVPENLTIKQRVFDEIDKHTGDHTILATCTSSLSIADITHWIWRPQRAIGLHFFNPVYAMKLVEIVPNKFTSNGTLVDAVVFVKRLGKIPIAVKDSPGFIVNRMLMLMINEAARMVEEGIALPGDIDEAMKLGANHPMGPLALADMIGIDTCCDILKIIQKDASGTVHGDKYSPHFLLEGMVIREQLGRKTKKGFYDYE